MLVLMEVCYERLRFIAKKHMRYFVQSFSYLQEHFLSWVAFFVVSFLVESMTFGFLSAQVWREAKRAFLSQQPPNIAAIFAEIPLESDLEAWLWFGGVRWAYRFVAMLFFLPIYITCQGLWKHMWFLGFFAYLTLLALVVLIYILESMLMYWVQLLYINGYFSPKDALRVNWAYVQKMSKPVLSFCGIENIIHLPLYFTCVAPALLSRPLIMIALLMVYEEEREHILQVATENGIDQKP